MPSNHSAFVGGVGGLGWATVATLRMLRGLNGTPGFSKAFPFFVGHNKVIQLMFFHKFPWTLLSNLLDVLELWMYVDFLGRR